MKKHMFVFPSRSRVINKVSWQRALESLPVMKSIFNKLILLLTGSLSKEWCIATYLFWQKAYRLGRKSGWLFLVLYLKQSRVALQRFVAGDKTPKLNVYVSLTKCGLPRIIPPFHRRMIRNGNPSVVQLYMSLFTIAKLIELAPKVTSELFKSIETPCDLDNVKQVSSDIKPFIKTLLKRYVPGIDKIPLKQGLTFDPTWKSVPTVAFWKKMLATHSKDDGSKFSRTLVNRVSSFVTLPYELAAFQALMTFCHARGEQYSQGCLWPPYVRYPFDKLNATITHWSLEWFEKRIGPYLPSPEAMGIGVPFGRLCQALTGDGKRRVFAIGNYINQLLLSPVHDWLASLLRRIPMDGTYDQTAPLDRLRGSSGVIHSVDLKAATDRWPLLMLFDIMQTVFGPAFASSAVNSALATNVFDISFLKKRQKSVISFVAGQPLGYRSSWPLFALSHHLIVWYAAELNYPGLRFTKYAILGDDIVIADSNVKTTYSELLTRLGVSISEAKSLTSPSGACEFAKKFRLCSMTIDASPVSIRKIMVSLGDPMGWYNLVTTHKGKPIKLSTALRLASVGFKASSRPLLCKKHGVKVKRLIIMRYMSHSKVFGVYLCLSVAIGKWVAPEVIGRLIVMMRDHYEPKDMMLPPVELFPHPGFEDFNHYTVYQGWMRQYLTYLRWAAGLYLKEDCSLDDFLDVPVYIRTWYRPGTTVEEFRFGILFRLADMAMSVTDSVIPLFPVLETSGKGISFVNDIETTGL